MQCTIGSKNVSWPGEHLCILRRWHFARKARASHPGVWTRSHFPFASRDRGGLRGRVLATVARTDDSGLVGGVMKWSIGEAATTAYNNI